MKVVHLSSVDFWEQGLLAYRIHKGVERHGIDSTFITFLKNSGDPTVKAIIRDPVFKEKIKLMETIPYNLPSPFIEIMEKWRNNLGIKIMNCQGEIDFSLPESEIDLSQLKEVEEADIIHLHWVPGLVNWEIAPLFFLKKPVIVTLYDMSFFTGGCHFPFDCKGYMEGCINCPKVPEEKQATISSSWKIKRQLFDYIDLKVVVQSTFLKNKVKELTLNKLEFILPNTPFLEYKHLPKLKARDVLGIEQDKNVIITVVPSLDSKIKEVKNLIDAINILKERKEIPRPYVIIIGSDYLQIDSKINFPLQHIPIIPNEEVLSWYYRASDIFVSTATYDPIGVYALDAMAMGLPVVGFADTIIEDLIVHKNTGYIAKNKDIEDLAQGIKFIIHMLQNKGTISKKIRSFVKQNCSWEIQTQKYVKLYDEAYNSEKNINVDKFITLGETFFEKGKKEVARKIFHELLKIEDTNSNILNNIGVLYWEEGRYSKAMEYFKLAYEINPEDKYIKENYLKATSLINVNKLGGSQ